MPTINRAFKEISCKIVYYGPGLGGKTTNLQIIHKQIPNKHRGELVSLATEQDRTLFFDFLPLDLGEVKGFKTKFQLYTVPGQVFYNATRKLVLRGVDGLVFVADSQVDRIDDNAESFKNLSENLQEYGLDVDSVPIVLQWNKRDLPNVASVEELNRSLNPSGKYKTFEAVACDGVGVKETLKAVSGMVLSRLNDQAISSGRPAQQSKLAEAAAKRRAAAAAAAPQPEPQAPADPGAPPAPAPNVIPQQPPQVDQQLGAVGAQPKPAGLDMSQQQSTAVADDEEIRYREEGRVIWKGFKVGSSSLEIARRKNVDGRGDFQLTGIVKGFLKKKYWFKMMEKATPPSDSAPNSESFIYFRERDDSTDKNPPVEAWYSPMAPKKLFVRVLGTTTEISPNFNKLKEIL